MIWARVSNNELAERTDRKRQLAERYLIGQCRNRSYDAAPPQKARQLQDSSKQGRSRTKNSRPRCDVPQTYRPLYCPFGKGDAQLLPPARALYRHNAAAAGATNRFRSFAAAVLPSISKL